MKQIAIALLGLTCVLPSVAMADESSNAAGKTPVAMLGCKLDTSRSLYMTTSVTYRHETDEGPLYTDIPRSCANNIDNANRQGYELVNVFAVNDELVYTFVLK